MGRDRFATMQAVPLEQSVGSLSQNLENVLGGPLHDIKDLVDEAEGNPFMKEVAHAIDKDTTGRTPTKRKLNAIGMEGDVRELAAAPALGHALGITEFA